MKWIVDGIEMVVCQRQRGKSSYWYGYWTDEDNRHRTCYIGGKLPPLPPAPQQEGRAFRCVVCHGYPTTDVLFVICPACREQVTVLASRKKSERAALASSS